MATDHDIDVDLTNTTNPLEIPTKDISSAAAPAPVKRDIDVDLTSTSSGLTLQTKHIPSKENYARWIAVSIVVIFGVTVILLMMLGFTLLIWLRWAPDKAELIFTKAVIPFVEKLATFATTVFGPLLAFILGYYFGEKSQGSQPNAPKQN